MEAQQLSLFGETEPILTVHTSALFAEESPSEWTFCAAYCEGEIRPYRLTLWPGQDREWTDPETHYCCDKCARETVARGNRMVLILANDQGHLSQPGASVATTERTELTED